MGLPVFLSVLLPKTTYTQQLPMGSAGIWVLASASVLGCRLAVEAFASSTEFLIYRDRLSVCCSAEVPPPSINRLKFFPSNYNNREVATQSSAPMTFFQAIGYPPYLCLQTLTIRSQETYTRTLLTKVSPKNDYAKNK